jgi:predicted RNA-binding protein with PIN domain
MRYIIDGYNVLHAWGMLRGSVRPGQLERARLNLLDRLRQAPGEITVVFDARRAPPKADLEEDYHGIHVFYTRDESADDRIEDLLREASRPADVTLVSSDRRLLEAARRRGCRRLRCLEYLEELQRSERPAPPPPPMPPSNAKPESVSPEEEREWLDAFGGVEDDYMI